jgi:hypothetical protein
MGFSDLKKSLQEAIEKSDNFSEFKKLMPDMDITQKAFNVYKKQQQGENGDVKKFEELYRSPKQIEPKRKEGIIRKQKRGIPRTSGRQESIDVAEGKPVWLKRGGLPKKPKMTGTGSYKGKKHSYAAGGMVKELKM